MPFYRVLVMQKDDNKKCIYKFKKADNEEAQEHLEDKIGSFFTERGIGFHAAIVCTGSESLVMTREELRNLLTRNNADRNVTFIDDMAGVDEVGCLCGIMECEDVIGCIEKMHNIMQRIRDNTGSEMQKQDAWDKLQDFATTVRTLSNNLKYPLENILEKEMVEQISSCMKECAVADVRVIFQIHKNFFDVFLQDDIFFPQQFMYVVEQMSLEEQNGILKSENIKKDVKISELELKISLYNDFITFLGFVEKDIERLNADTPLDLDNEFAKETWKARVYFLMNKDNILQDMQKKYDVLMLSYTSKEIDDEKRELAKARLSQWWSNFYKRLDSFKVKESDIDYAYIKEESADESSKETNEKQIEQIKPDEAKDSKDKPKDPVNDPDKGGIKAPSDGGRDDGDRE